MQIVQSSAFPPLIRLFCRKSALFCIFLQLILRLIGHLFLFLRAPSSCKLSFLQNMQNILRNAANFFADFALFLHPAAIREAENRGNRNCGAQSKGFARRSRKGIFGIAGLHITRVNRFTRHARCR
nr:hypothetical protein [uncultured Agathobaculum sp.]